MEGLICNEPLGPSTGHTGHCGFLGDSERCKGCCAGSQAGHTLFVHGGFQCQHACGGASAQCVFFKFNNVSGIVKVKVRWIYSVLFVKPKTKQNTLEANTGKHRTDFIL